MPVERPRCLMGKAGMRTVDRARLPGGHRGLATLILHGRRHLSNAPIRTLAAHFKVDAGLSL